MLAADGSDLEVAEHGTWAEERCEPSDTPLGWRSGATCTDVLLEARDQKAEALRGFRASKDAASLEA